MDVCRRRHRREKEKRNPIDYRGRKGEKIGIKRTHIRMCFPRMRRPAAFIVRYRAVGGTEGVDGNLALPCQQYPSLPIISDFFFLRSFAHCSDALRVDLVRLAAPSPTNHVTVLLSPTSRAVILHRRALLTVNSHEKKTKNNQKWERKGRRSRRKRGYLLPSFAWRLRSY
jgi:hypothetical protein